MAALGAQEEMTHKTILDTGIVDDTELTNKVSCICIVLDMSNRHFMMSMGETWLIWRTAGPYWIIKVIRSAEKLDLIACLIGKTFIPCK